MSDSDPDSDSTSFFYLHFLSIGFFSFFFGAFSLLEIFSTGTFSSSSFFFALFLGSD